MKACVLNGPLQKLEETFDLQLCRRSEILVLARNRRPDVTVPKASKHEAATPNWAFRPTLNPGESPKQSNAGELPHKVLRKSKKVKKEAEDGEAEAKTGTNKQLPGSSFRTQESKSPQQRNETNKAAKGGESLKCRKGRSYLSNLSVRNAFIHMAVDTNSASINYLAELEKKRRDKEALRLARQKQL
ncbi:hypothetical protein EMWEY_00006280 [Eimeria maxima]|uniref:Uncharacterized protein n=1 Tax=Eimeria maxima TaxID=5804 RepID=U6MD46_EIMMA|nr:hypothetical protein EMWEY_00006280 [Eimeria maxima]CDJ60389.1 hypothetical protein EMWEY_00006280 [Eimeria maxima]